MKHKDRTDFEKWLRGRFERLPEPEVSAEFLAAQRRNIYRRLNERHRNWIPMRWTMSFAMFLLMVAGGLTLQLRHKPAPAVSAPVSGAVSDDQLFSDLAAMEQSNEPKAIQPIHGLFQE